MRGLTQPGRRVLAAGAVAIALMTGPAWAGPITFDPSASNHIGIPTSPGLVLDSAVNSVDATGGGLAALYEDLNIGTNGSYNAQFLFNITSFTNTSTSQIGSGWQLFAVVAMQGLGACSPSCGVGTGSWAASTATTNIELYATKGAPLTFPVNGRTGISNSTGNGLITAVTNNASLLGGQMRNGWLNPSSNSFLEFTEPNGDVGGFAGAGGANTPACIDPATNTSTINANANCILLATGSTTTNSPNLSMSVVNTNTNGTELFSIQAPLTPEAYAYGAGGFFPSSDPVILDLQVLSGAVLEQENPDTVFQENSNVTGEYDTKNHTDQVNWSFTNATQDGSQGEPIPEPSSLAIFGMTLLGVGAFARRRSIR